jgi:hypothetical protein
MQLPQPNLKAKDLPRDLVPYKEVVQAYEAVGHDYERSCHDRAYEIFYAQVTGKDDIKNQEISQTISSLQRLKDSKGKEWLVYGVELSGNNWKRNKVDFYHTEGKIEGIPIFHNEIDPQTDQIVSGTTQVEEIKTIYTFHFPRKR